MPINTPIKIAKLVTLNDIYATIIQIRLVITYILEIVLESTL
jgi:hypothetical protein